MLYDYALVSAYAPRYKRNKELKPILTVLAKMKLSVPSLLVAVFLLCEILQEASANRRSRWNYRRKMRYQAARIPRGECKDKDESQETCAKVIKELGYQVCETEIAQLRAKLQRSCAKSCNFCGPPKRNCRYSKYQCCWDGVTPRGNIYGTKGCPECKDHMLTQTLCKRFQRRCSTNAFLQLHCPKSCGRCFEKRSMPIKGQRVTIQDWHKL